MHLINDHNAWSFAAMDSLHWDSVIRGHHVYKDIWTPFIGEVLRVEQETHNVQDQFAVAVVRMTLQLALCHMKFRALFGTSSSTMEL